MRTVGDPYLQINCVEICYEALKFFDFYFCPFGFKCLFTPRFQEVLGGIDALNRLPGNVTQVSYLVNGRDHRLSTSAEILFRPITQFLGIF